LIMCRVIRGNELRKVGKYIFSQVKGHWWNCTKDLRNLNFAQKISAEESKCVISRHAYEGREERGGEDEENGPLPSQG